MAAGHSALYLHPSPQGIGLGLRVGIEVDRTTLRFFAASAALGEAAWAIVGSADGRFATELVDKALDDLRSARESVERARGALSRLSQFLDANRDPEYEQQLRSSGLRGSQFLISELRQSIVESGRREA